MHGKGAFFGLRTVLRPAQVISRAARAVRAALEGLEGIFLSVPVCCLPDGRYVPPRRGRCLGVTCMVAVMEEPAAAPLWAWPRAGSHDRREGMQEVPQTKPGKAAGQAPQAQRCQGKDHEKSSTQGRRRPSLQDGRGERRRDQAVGRPGRGGKCSAIQRAHCWGVFWRASQRRVA